MIYHKDDEILSLVKHKETIEDCLEFQESTISFKDIRQLEKFKNHTKQLKKIVEEIDIKIEEKKNQHNTILRRIKIVNRIFMILPYPVLATSILLMFNNHDISSILLMFFTLLLLFLLILIKNTLVNTKKAILVFVVPIFIASVFYLIPTSFSIINDNASLFTFLSLVYAIIFPFFNKSFYNS